MSIKTELKNTIRGRLMGILRRFVLVEDYDLSDDHLVRTVFDRYLEAREQPLIDPNE